VTVVGVHNQRNPADARCNSTYRAGLCHMRVYDVWSKTANELDHACQ
jgi:hypothetical protein